MPAPEMGWLKIVWSNESDCGLSVAVMVASSSRAARMELGEAVTIRSWSFQSLTYIYELLGISPGEKRVGERLPRCCLELQSYQL